MGSSLVEVTLILLMLKEIMRQEDSGNQISFKINHNQGLLLEEYLNQWENLLVKPWWGCQQIINNINRCLDKAICKTYLIFFPNNYLNPTFFLNIIVIPLDKFEEIPLLSSHKINKIPLVWIYWGSLPKCLE